MLSTQEIVRSVGNRIADVVKPDFGLLEKTMSRVRRPALWGMWSRIRIPPEEGHWSFKRAWFALVILAVLLTSITLCVSHYLAGGTRGGLVCSVVVWALMTGGFVTFIAPAKVVTAVVGAILGAGAASASSGSGFSGIVSIVDGVANTMSTSLARLEPVGLSTPDQPFVAALVWIYCGIVLLLCLPAFFSD